MNKDIYWVRERRNRGTERKSEMDRDIDSVREWKLERDRDRQRQRDTGREGEKKKERERVSES